MRAALEIQCQGCLSPFRLLEDVPGGQPERRLTDHCVIEYQRTNLATAWSAASALAASPAATPLAIDVTAVLEDGFVAMARDLGPGRPFLDGDTAGTAAVGNALARYRRRLLKAGLLEGYDGNLGTNFRTAFVYEICARVYRPTSSTHSWGDA